MPYRAILDILRPLLAAIDLDSIDDCLQELASGEAGGESEAEVLIGDQLNDLYNLASEARDVLHNVIQDVQDLRADRAGML